MTVNIIHFFLSFLYLNYLSFASRFQIWYSDHQIRKLLLKILYHIIITKLDIHFLLEVLFLIVILICIIFCLNIGILAELVLGDLVFKIFNFSSILPNQFFLFLLLLNLSILDLFIHFFSFLKIIEISPMQLNCYFFISICCPWSLF